MANRYWVGGTATWDATAGSKWATTSGGAGGQSVPTAADDVFLDAASGAVTVTLASSTVLACRSIDCTGFTGGLTQGTSNTLNVGDASGGAFKLVVGMTFTNVAGAQVVFVSTSSNGGAGWGITTAGKDLRVINFNGTGGKWVLQDSLTLGVSGNVLTLTAGTLDTNSQSVTCGLFTMSSGSATRNLTAGTTNFTITGASTVGWAAGTTTNGTASLASSTITFSGAGVTAQLGSVFTYGTLIFSGASSAAIGSAAVGNGAAACSALTRTGTAAKTDTFNFTSAVTVTGTLTLNSNSGVNRLLVQSSVVGTARTITAANVVISNIVDFMDITGAGAATWTVAGTGATALGDCGGNSGITFTAPATQTHTASAGGNWSDVTKWTSRVPLPQDNVVVDVNTTGTLTADMPRLGADITFTGFTGLWSNSGTSTTNYGSFTVVANMSITMGGGHSYAGRGNHTITSAGKTFNSNQTFVGPGSTYTLQDSFTTLNTFGVNDGTLTTNNNSVTCSTFAAISGRTAILNLGTSTINLTSIVASATVINTPTVATTVNGSTATFVISTASTGLRFVSAMGTAQNQTFGTITYTVANSPGALQFVPAQGVGGSINVGTLNLGSGRQLQVTVGRTLAVTNWNVNGVANGRLYLPGVTANYAKTALYPALAITGDLSLRIKFQMDAFTAASQHIFSRANNALVNSASSWTLLIGSVGTPQLLLMPGDGTVGSTVTASGSLTLADVQAGVELWSTWRQSDGRVQFFKRGLGGGAWTQVGGNGTFASASIQAGTNDLFIGQRPAIDGGWIGSIYRAQVRNNLNDDDSGLVFDADFTTHNAGSSNWLDAAKTQFTESSSNAATVTINGSFAQVGDGRVALTSSTPGSTATLSKSSGIVSSSYLSIQDSTATGGASWHALSSANAGNNSGWIFGSTPNTTGNFTIFGGPN